MYIHPKGNPLSDVWVIIDTPISTDKDKGYVFSGGMGYIFDQMMRDAGLPNYYVRATRPDLKVPEGYINIQADLNIYKPKIIIPLDHIGQKLCKELIVDPKDRNKNKSSEIEKYSGSLLISDQLQYPHYVIPTFGPQRVMAQYKIRDQVVYCDLAKAAGELEYFKQYGSLNPLPQRTLKIDFDTFDELLSIIDSFLNYPLLSNDIETIYPKKGSQFYKKHPGYPITIGLAPSKDFGISFDLFRESKSETIELWRRLNRVFKSVPQIGQNFFNFDINFYEALGFEILDFKVKDTIIRHHVLWPELPHKLGFLTRQYTRQPFYKDDGKQWSLKDLRGLKRYNALDACVTLEVFEREEEEFNERPYLR